MVRVAFVLLHPLFTGVMLDNYLFCARMLLFLSSCDRLVLHQILFPSYTHADFHMMLQKSS